jgi:hypothetical protein
MKKFILSAFCLFALFILSFAQETTTVEVKGVGLNREDALQDALRNAVGQAMGVAVSSQTQVENFMVLSDAISTKTEGYIASYKVVKETPMRDRFEILVQAVVSLSPLKADVNMLARTIGGIRFLVMYDPRKLKEEDVEIFNFAVERINEALSNRKYRYIESQRFQQLQKEAQRIFQESGDSNEETYVQQLGFKADAQFIIKISNIIVSQRSEAFDTRTASKVTIELKAYDNCTAEGLGTIIMESDWSSGRDPKATLMTGVSTAIAGNIDNLFKVFNSYIGDWVNNGIPYELRFYASGSFRDFRELRNKLKDDKNFGGQMEIVGFDNYTKLNCTFRKRPDELADRILDISDKVPFFAEREMDVRLIYGRQISFAPRKAKVPELDSMKDGYNQIQETDKTTQPSEVSKPAPNKTTEPAKTTTTPTTTKPTTTPKSKTTKPKTTNPVKTSPKTK